MTQSPRMCEKCGIFIAWVLAAGEEKLTLCYPCYFWRLLGNYGDAIKWLEFRRISGEEEDVIRWYKWNEANRHNNTVQEPVWFVFLLCAWRCAFRNFCLCRTSFSAANWQNLKEPRLSMDRRWRLLRMYQAIRLKEVSGGRIAGLDFKSRY